MSADSSVRFNFPVIRMLKSVINVPLFPRNFTMLNQEKEL